MIHFCFPAVLSRLNGSNPEEGYGLLLLVSLIAFAATLPVVGFGLRTLRSAFEFSRNTVRYRAMHAALVDLDKSLQRHVDRLDSSSGINAMVAIEDIYADLWWSEHVLELEHREWLRLMIEAEWFG